MLNFESHHQLHQKVGVVKTLDAGAQYVCSDQDSLTSEGKTLKLAFQECEDPDWALCLGETHNIHQGSDSKDDCRGYV